MRKGLPSGTSFLVSFARGLGVDDEQVDALAPHFLPPWLGKLAAAPARLGGAAPLYRSMVRATTLGLIDHAVLRTAAIDLHLDRALRTGIDQLVILGAGLDARGWRVESLRKAVVFEVDHEATQRYKRRRIATRVPPTDIRYVRVDFEHEGFAERLRASGFRHDAPSAWIWEGVTMYLPVAAVRHTVEQITSLSTEGSFLALTYRAPGMLPWGSLGEKGIPLVFAAAGEPLKAAFEPEELARLVEPAWRVVYDEDARGWQKLTGSAARPSPLFSSERLAVVERRR